MEVTEEIKLKLHRIKQLNEELISLKNGSPIEEMSSRAGEVLNLLGCEQLLGFMLEAAFEKAGIKFNTEVPHGS